MKKFLLGCVVGGFTVSKVYDWCLKYYDYKPKPEKCFSDIFNNLRWYREEHIKNAIEQLKENSEEQGHLTIYEMMELFSLDQSVIDSRSRDVYAKTCGLTYDDICKITYMKSIRDGKWRLLFHDGIANYFDHFIRVVWEEDENDEKEGSR